MVGSQAIGTSEPDAILPAWLVVHVARAGTERQRAQQLLDWPGDGEADAGEVFVLVDPAVEAGDGLHAAALVVGRRPAERELRRLAVAQCATGGPIGRRLIEEVGNIQRACGIRLLHAQPTALPESLSALLMELGFRRCAQHPQLTLEL